MATTYIIINVKVSSGKFEGVDFDNRIFLCYTNESSKYLVCGNNTDSLKIRKDDFVYCMKSKNLQENQLPGNVIVPVFDKNGYMIDFTLSKPDTGEVV